MISIIMPVYKVEQYLDRCLSSIVAQTYTDFELLLVDDGSPDRCGEICDGWAQKDSRIKVLHQSNLGVSASRNRALDAARGEYITFVDSDDWLEVDCLQQMMNLAEATGADIVCCNHFNDGTKQKVNYRYKDALISKEKALDCYSEYYFTTVWGKLYRCDCLAGLRFREDIFYSEDTLFYTQAVMNAQTVYWMRKPLYHYFINPIGAMKQGVFEKRMTDFDARLAIVELYSEYPTLQKGAVCRAVSSAVSIALLAQRQGNSQHDACKRVYKYLKENRNAYLRCKHMSKKNMLVTFLCSFSIGRWLYCYLNNRTA